METARRERAEHKLLVSGKTLSILNDCVKFASASRLILYEFARSAPSFAPGANVSQIEIPAALALYDPLKRESFFLVSGNPGTASCVEKSRDECSITFSEHMYPRFVWKRIIDAYSEYLEPGEDEIRRYLRRLTLLSSPRVVYFEAKMEIPLSVVRPGVDVYGAPVFVPDHVGDKLWYDGLLRFSGSEVVLQDLRIIDKRFFEWIRKQFEPGVVTIGIYGERRALDAFVSEWLERVLPEARRALCGQAVSLMLFLRQ